MAALVQYITVPACKERLFLFQCVFKEVRLELRKYPVYKFIGTLEKEIGMQL